MNIKFDAAFHLILREAGELLATLQEKTVKNFLEKIQNEWPRRRLFFWARGRSFLMLKGFAMRLMHMGYEVHLVGEPDCPSIAEGDVFMIASGSGGTASVLLFAQKAKEVGASVVGVVGKQQSKLAEIADFVIEFSPQDAPPTKQLSSGGGGTRFEHALMHFFDSVVLAMVYERREEAYQEMMVRHANLE